MTLRLSSSEVMQQLNPTIAGNRFSIKLFILALVFTGAALAWLSWSTYRLYADDSVIKGQIWRTEELRSTIVHLDEVLTMSARMAAATGDPQWEARYRKFEPQLDQRDQRDLETGPIGNTSPDGRRQYAISGDGKPRLHFGTRDKTAEAWAILSSQQYEMQKGIYALGMTSFLEQLQFQLEATQRSQRRRAVFSAGAGVAVLAILLFSWLAIIRRMYKSHALLLGSIARRKQTEEALRKAQRELELRVQERTSELTIANTSLKEQVSERTRAEAALRQSEERYRDLFENANDIIYTHDLQGNYTSVNKACEKILGYTSEEAVRMNIAQLVAPEYLEEAQRRLAQKAHGKRAVVLRNGNHCQGWTRGLLLEVKSRLTYENGNPTGVQGMARDITERKRAEMERQVIAEIVQSVITTANLDELFKLAHQAINKILPAENCFIALHNLTTDLMHYEYWVDKFDPAPRRTLSAKASAVICCAPVNHYC